MLKMKYFLSHVINKATEKNYGELTIPLFNSELICIL